MEVVPVDSSAMQVSEQTSMAKVHFLFTVLGLSHIYITARGRLVGVITRKLLIHAISGRVPKSFV
jgi:CBS domain-containing protein